MAWGLGLEPRFSDSKSDVLPIRRPPNDRSRFNVQGSKFKLRAARILSFEGSHKRLEDPSLCSGQALNLDRITALSANGRRAAPSFTGIAPLASWLGDQESNLDSQIQNLMSYQLDDPQMQRAPAGQCLLGLFIQKADHSLPSTM